MFEFNDYSKVTDDDFRQLAIYWKTKINNQNNTESDRIAIVKNILRAIKMWPSNIFDKFHDFLVDSDKNGDEVFSRAVSVNIFMSKIE